MANHYVSLGEVKAAIGQASTYSAEDTALNAWIADASRWADRRRRFYSAIETRYYDGTGCPSLRLGYDGVYLLTVTTLKVDEDGDGTYEKTLTANTDYWLSPDNTSPKRCIDLNPVSSNINVFPSGRRRVQVVGRFGHSDDTVASGTLGAAITDTTGTSVTMTAGHGLTGGETIRVDSEDMFVVSVSTNTLTVQRGVNGSTAATHSNGAAVTKRSFPADLVGAILLEVSRTWRSARTGQQAQAGAPDIGGFSFGSPYPIIEDRLSTYAIPGVA